MDLIKDEIKEILVFGEENQQFKEIEEKTSSNIGFIKMRDVFITLSCLHPFFFLLLLFLTTSESILIRLMDLAENQILIKNLSGLIIIAHAILTVSLTLILLAPMTLKKFQKKFPENEPQISDYVKIGRIVVFTSHDNELTRGHELKIGSKNVCSGCFGIIIGAFCSLFYSWLILDVMGKISVEMLGWIFLLGTTLLFVSYLKYFTNSTGFWRLLLNFSLPISISLIFSVFLGLLMSSIEFIFPVAFLLTEIFCRYIIAKLDHKSIESTE